MYLLITAKSTWKTHGHFKSNASKTDCRIHFQTPLQGSPAQDMALIPSGSHAGTPGSHPLHFFSLMPWLIHNQVLLISNFSAFKNRLLFPTFQYFCNAQVPLIMICCLNWEPLHGSPTATPAPLQWFIFHDQSYHLGDKFDSSPVYA